MFKILLSSSSRKFLGKCDKNLYNRVLRKIKGLSINPFPLNVKRIIGKEDKIFRIRVGDYRILYLVNFDKNEVFIADIDKRGRIYKR